MSIVSPPVQEGITENKSAEEEKNALSQEERDEQWRLAFVEGHPVLRGFQEQHLLGYPKATERCVLCKTPFNGPGAPLPGKGRAHRNRHFCSACDGWMELNHPGDVLDDFTTVAIDIRGSVRLSHTIGSKKFKSQYLPKFWAATSRALFDTFGFLVEVRGDEIRGVYPPGFSGAAYAQQAVEGPRRLLQDFPPRTDEGDPVPIGIGVCKRELVIGTEGEPGDFQRVDLVGDSVNFSSRICKEAGPGEALFSEESWKETGHSTDGLEQRLIKVEDREGTVDEIPVYVVTATSPLEKFEIKEPRHN